jgi:hypothetical protein
MIISLARLRNALFNKLTAARLRVAQAACQLGDPQIRRALGFLENTRLSARKAATRCQRIEILARAYVDHPELLENSQSQLA